MSETREHKVKTDYGIGEYYRSFQKKYKKGHISRKVFGEILKEFGSYVRDSISTKGTEYIFPSRIGKIELRKVKPEVTIDADGNIVNKLPTNWKETRKLWNENESAREKKIKIRFTNEHTDGYTFRIFYLRSKANYKNKSIYKLQFNREMKRNLSHSIFKGRIDAFLN
tara:strand:+ start:13200 stop:13703 length:504 start_codon:yes stop_codon:yes gene_type:complete